MEEDWEVVGSEDGVEWVEVSRSRSQSPHPLSFSADPHALAALETQLAEARVSFRPSNTSSLFPGVVNTVIGTCRAS